MDTREIALLCADKRLHILPGVAPGRPRCCECSEPATVAAARLAPAEADETPGTIDGRELPMVVSRISFCTPCADEALLIDELEARYSEAVADVIASTCADDSPEGVALTRAVDATREALTIARRARLARDVVA